MLKFKTLISLQASKVNDCAHHKSPGFKIISQTKPKNIAVHVETIGLQKDTVRRALTSILLRTDRDLNGTYLQLVPILFSLTDKK